MNRFSAFVAEAVCSRCGQPVRTWDELETGPMCRACMRHLALHGAILKHGRLHRMDMGVTHQEEPYNNDHEHG